MKSEEELEAEMREPRKELEEASKECHEFIDPNPVDLERPARRISGEKMRIAFDRYHKALDRVYKLLDERYSK